MQEILAGTLEDLETKGRLIVKSGKRQILILRSSKGLHAVDHRCPHEGYPLSQGIQNDCVLTCAYHNWKFDLQTGQNSVGGDGLKVWPMDIRDGNIFVSICEPDPIEVQKEAIDQIKEAMAQRNAGLLMRGLARYIGAKGNVWPLIESTIQNRAVRYQWGFSHSLAAAVDWLELIKTQPGLHQQLAILEEIFFEINEETLTLKVTPFLEGEPPKHQSLPQLIEAESEDSLLWIGPNFKLEGENLKELISSTLFHYRDFGHCLIYLHKAWQLSQKIPGLSQTLGRLLVRNLIYSTREDDLPQFVKLKACLNQPFTFGPLALKPEDLSGSGISECLQWLHNKEGYSAESILESLVYSGALCLMKFDPSLMDQVEVIPAQQESWLSFTHILTFASALKDLGPLCPESFASGLRQMASFVGRGHKALTQTPDLLNAHCPTETELLEMVSDIDTMHPVLAAHRVKTLYAVKHLALVYPNLKTILFQALYRYLNYPMRTKFPRRLAWQSLQLVGRDVDLDGVLVLLCEPFSG